MDGRDKGAVMRDSASVRLSGLLAALGACAVALLAMAPAAMAGAQPPVVTASTPAFAGTNANPAIKGTTQGSPILSVLVYNGPGCTGTSTAGTEAEFTGSGISAPVAANNATTQFSAAAFNGPNGTGANYGCSATNFSYTHNDPPLITHTNPGTPGNDSTPSVIGDSGAAVVTVVVYNEADCAGTATSGTKFAFDGLGFAAPVANENASNTFSARAQVTVAAVDYPASDCSNNLTYVHDNIAPDPPTILGSTPASGGSENMPFIYGSSSGANQVALFGAPDCDGPAPPITFDGAGIFAAPGLQLTVPDNSTTIVYAAANDDANNVSACSAGFTYVEGNGGLPPPGGGPGASTPAPLIITPAPPAAAPIKCKKGRKLKRGKCVKKKKK